MNWILARMTPILIVAILPLLAWHGLTYLKLGAARVEASLWQHKAESLKAQAAIHELEKAGLLVSIEAQNKAVAALKYESEARAQIAREARKAAHAASVEAESRIAKIMRRTGETCEDAMQLARDMLSL